MKKLRILCGFILIMLFILTGCSNKNSQKNRAISISQDQVLDGIKISDLDLENENDITNIVAFIENETDDNMYISRIDFTLKNNEGVIIGDLVFWVDKTLKPNEKEKVTASISSDITDASMVTYQIIK